MPADYFRFLQVHGGAIRVRGLAKGGPAEQSNMVNVGDELVQVDDIDVHGRPLSELGQYVLGEHPPAFVSDAVLLETGLAPFIPRFASTRPGVCDVLVANADGCCACGRESGFDCQLDAAGFARPADVSGPSSVGLRASSYPVVLTEGCGGLRCT